MKKDDYFHKLLFAVLFTSSVVTYCLVTTKTFFYFWIEYFEYNIVSLAINYVHHFFPFYLEKPFFVSKAMWKSNLEPHAKNETFVICCFELCEYFHQLIHCLIAHLCISICKNG